MGYKAVFLDGTNGLPYVECEVCKRLERNVIEPAFTYIEESVRTKNYSKDMINNLVLKSKNLNNGEFRCIFHCEKENNVWIKNFKKGMNLVDANLVWNQRLVDDFWKQIRCYRFAIDYYKKTIQFNKIKKK